VRAAGGGGRRNRRPGQHLADSPAVAWDSKLEVYEAFVAEPSYTQFEWVASGYGVSFLVDVVNSVCSELVVAGLTYAVTKMRGRKKRDAPWSPSIEDLESGGVTPLKRLRLCSARRTTSWSRGRRTSAMPSWSGSRAREASIAWP
jgi:hypothetical protein